MANIDAPFGLRPIAKQGSAPGGTIGTTKYKISSGASALFTGDPVKLKADGSIEVKGGAGAITGAISGVFMGCFYTDPTSSKPTYSAHYPASTNASDIVAYVYDDPMIVFEAQHDGTGTAAMNFGGFDYVGLSGDDTSGLSKAELDTSTVTTSGNFQQLGISKDPENSDTSAANANAYVIVNGTEHQLNSATTLG